MNPCAGDKFSRLTVSLSMTDISHANMSLQDGEIEGVGEDDRCDIG